MRTTMTSCTRYRVFPYHGTHLVHSPNGGGELAAIDNTQRCPYIGVQKTENPQIELGEPVDSDVEEVEEIPNYVSTLVLELLGTRIPHVTQSLPVSFNSNFYHLV